MDKRNALLKVAYAMLDTIVEAGPEGAPAGPMYLAFMQAGGTIEQFNGIIQALVTAGKVTVSGNVIIAILK